MSFFNKKNAEVQIKNQQEKQKNMEQCQKEVDEVLAKYNCRLTINHTIGIISK